MKILFEINRDVVGDFIYRKIQVPIYFFKESMGSLIFWLPIIWKDRDWDYIYLLILMEAKMRKMKNFFVENGQLAHSKKELKKMEIAASLLKRIRESKYSDDLINKYIKKYNFNISRVGRKISEEEKVCIKKIMEYEEYMLRQDLEYFGNVFKNVRRWWD